MSREYASTRDVPTAVIADRLSELADVVSHHRDRICSEFTMRIPAECDRDADLVLAEASRRLLEIPAVQGEPVAYAVFAENGNIRIWCADPIQAETLRQQYGEALQPLYAAPQPAAQQPTEGEEIMVNTPYDVFTLPLQPSGLGGKGPRFVVHVPGHPAAPDVTALVEALETIQKVATHKSSIRTGIHAAITLGCISAICNTALAAHQQGGEA